MDDFPRQKQTRQKTSDQFKQDFNHYIFQVVNELFGQHFNVDSAFQMVQFYDALKQTQKKQVWDIMTTKMQDSTRLILYKYFNNTFKSAASPQWPAHLLEQFAACAREQALYLAADASLNEQDAVRRGVEIVKQIMNVRSYADYHQETAHHKIRNALVPAFRKARESGAGLTTGSSATTGAVAGALEREEFKLFNAFNQSVENMPEPSGPLINGADYLISNNAQLKLSTSIYDLPVGVMCEECPEFDPFEDEIWFADGNDQ